jgi:hypothetical protein
MRANPYVSSKLAWNRLSDGVRFLQATCPVCGRGPLTERDIAELQKADGTKPTLGAKKSGYSVAKIVSSPGSSSSKEVLTLLSSDDEDTSASSPSDVKGKGKAKVTEITLDSDSDDDNDGASESDDYMPSSPPPAAAGNAIEDDLGAATTTRRTTNLTGSTSSPEPTLGLRPNSTH